MNIRLQKFHNRDHVLYFSTLLLMGLIFCFTTSISDSVIICAIKCLFITLEYRHLEDLGGDGGVTLILLFVS